MPALTKPEVDALNRNWGDMWKKPPNPTGLYQQAPDGSWWRVDPFTGETPWDKSTPTGKKLPAGFEDIFGPEPGVGDPRRERWLTDLEYYQGAGLPDGFTQEQVNTANRVYEDWGMGKVRFYQGRYGWMARWPDCALPVFENDVMTAIEIPHLVIPRYQVRLSMAGMRPGKIHPWVPPHLFPEVDPR